MIGGWLAPVPGKQLVETTDRKVGDTRQDVGQPGLRVDVVELGGGDQASDDGGALAAAVRTGQQPCLAAEAIPRSARSAALLVKQIRPS